MIVTNYIYRTSSIVSKALLTAKTESKEKTDQAACFTATIPLQVIGDKDHVVAAWAGQQWGKRELTGENVIAVLVEENAIGFEAFLKDNGYERIPEKEEEPK